MDTAEWHFPQCPYCEAKRIKEKNKQYVELQIQRVIDDAKITPRFQKATFENFHCDLESLRSAGKTNYTKEHVDEMRFARDQVKQWSDSLPKISKNMALLGKVGTGKDHLASACITTLIRRKYARCLMISAQRVFMEIKQLYSAGKSDLDYLKNLAELDVLVINEIGVQLKTDWEFEKMSWIINERVNNMKPYMIISNEDIATLEATLGTRLMDRIFQDGNHLVNFTWPSYRRKGV